MGPHGALGHLRAGNSRWEVYGKTDFMDFVRSARGRAPPPEPPKVVETIDNGKPEDKPAEGEAAAKLRYGYGIEL